MFLTCLGICDNMFMVPQGLKRMVTDGLPLDVTVVCTHFPERGYVYGDSFSKGGPSIMSEIVQVLTQITVAISAAGQLVLKLIEFFEHKKSNRPDQG